jgi:hypothetical protein
MRVRLPKPLRGWREFGGEVGVIVLGVLIALAAQQAVEWVHERQDVAQLRGALRPVGRLAGSRSLHAATARRARTLGHECAG